MSFQEFNLSTDIIAHDSSVYVGSFVGTLIDALEEPGYKSVEWNAGGLASIDNLVVCE